MQQEGKLGKIIFNNPENGYTVAVFDTEAGAIRIAGSFAEPKSGAKYRLEGRFTIHPKYGEQFSVSSYEEMMPEGADAILEFLSAHHSTVLILPAHPPPCQSFQEHKTPC